MSLYQEESYESVSQDTDLEKDLLERQLVLEKDTRKYLVLWTLVSQSNLLLHFVRLGVVIVYCTEVLHNGAPPQLAGAMVTAHYWTLAASNFHAVLSLGSKPLDSVICWHFPVLALITVAEALAPNFSVFAPVYVCAGLGIVCPPIAEAAAIQMASRKLATDINIFIAITSQIVLVLGLASGGLIATFTNYRTVFWTSALWAALCSVFIFFNLRGEAQKLKERRTQLAAELYSQFPDAVATDMQFPAATDGADEKQGAISFLSSAQSIPFWLLSLYNALGNSRILEFLVWWPLYTRSNFGASLSSSNVQSVCCVLCGTVGTGIFTMILPPTGLSEAKQLKQTTLLCTVSAVVCAFIVAIVIPRMDSLSECWLPFALMGFWEGILWPLIAARDVAETPHHLVGPLMAVRVATVITIPGLQHSVIGALWNVREDHRYYLFWVAFLELLSIVVVVAYTSTRKSLNSRRNAGTYEVIDH